MTIKTRKFVCVQKLKPTRLLISISYVAGSSTGFTGFGFPLFEARDSGFKSKIEARFGVESMRGRLDAKNNPRDYGIEGPYWGPSCYLTLSCFFFYKNVFYKNIEAEIFQNLIMIRISPRLKRI